MRRFHLFEFEDLPWFPSLIRDAGTAFLEFVARQTHHGEALAPVLERALDQAHEDRIIDLCSGGSGPLPSALAVLEERKGRTVRATLTDLYPNQNAFQRMIRDHPTIDAEFESVDATSVPPHLKGLRTLFSGLHHFRPAEAKGILANAVQNRESIAIFEVVARHPVAIFGMFLTPWMTLVAVPFLRPFRWGWIPLTYLIPVVPLFIFWDGLVSCLRCYSQDELEEMTSDLTSADYQWEIGGLDVPGVPFKGVYAIGSPTRAQASA